MWEIRKGMLCQAHRKPVGHIVLLELVWAANYGLGLTHPPEGKKISGREIKTSSRASTEMSMETRTPKILI